MVEKKQQIPAVRLKSFAIIDHHHPLRTLWWNYHLWPEVKRLYQTTWPDSANRVQRVSTKERLQDKGSVAIIMRDSQSRKLIGFSIIQHLQDDRPDVAYNRSVIIDPKFRSKGLMIPLLEEQMRHASLLGYSYMWGEYNANIGEMPDGRRVRRGFAAKIKDYSWENGTIIQHVRYPYDSVYGSIEAILFRLNSQVNGQKVMRRRR